MTLEIFHVLLETWMHVAEGSLPDLYLYHPYLDHDPCPDHGPYPVLFPFHVLSSQVPRQLLLET